VILRYGTKTKEMLPKLIKQV